VFKEIGSRVKVLLSKRTEKMVEELKSIKESHRQFELLRVLKVNMDSARRPLALEDDNGYEHTSPASVIPMVEAFYEKFFNYSADEDTRHFDEHFVPSSP